MARGITNRMAELLSRSGMTQKELSRASGVTESAISHYMRGERVPRGANLLRIAKALGTTADYLLSQDVEDNRREEVEMVKTILARNASKMTKEEKMELLSILISNE